MQNSGGSFLNGSELNQEGFRGNEIYDLPKVCSPSKNLTKN